MTSVNITEGAWLIIGHIDLNSNGGSVGDSNVNLYNSTTSTQLIATYQNTYSGQYWQPATVTTVAIGGGTIQLRVNKGTGTLQATRATLIAVRIG